MAVSQTLTLTEVANSTNLSANTSKVRILWQSTQSGDSWNGYTKTAKYYISINGEAEREYTVSYILPQSTTTTILDTTITVTHKGDGTGTVKVRTWMDTRISAGVVEKTQTLTLSTIPRASTITSASNITLGNACTIKWTPLSTSFRYKLKFTLGDFSYTTGALHPNTVAAYTYDKYTLPIADIAPKITGKPPTASMTVTLYTYSDSNASVQIGSASSTTFTVTVPDNTSTKPTVTMTLSPVTPYTKFASLYLQGRSKVKATFSGSGKYGASITSYNMQVDGKNYASPYTSDILKKSGSVDVVGIATDSRGFSGIASQSINVIAYDPPYIAPSEGYKNVICERSTSGKVASDTGTYLHVKGTRNYTKINTGGIVNTCSVRCRYKPEGGSWSHNPGDGVAVLLYSDTSTDEFDVALPNVVSNIKLSYMVELNIVDDAGIASTMVFNIPSERVDFQLREGGNGAAFGKHAIIDNLFECEFDAQFNHRAYFNSISLMETEIEIGGDADTYYPVYVKHGEGYRNTNTQPIFLGLGKMLNTQSGSWEGNHSSYSSSICMAWLYRIATWDGNGEYIIPLYKNEQFAKLIAHIGGLGELMNGLVLYLRGGGATYRLVSSVPIVPMVCLDSTDISANPTYPVMVTPRGYEGNKGINFTNGIVADFVIEQGTSGIWEYRKWYSGKVECWGKWAIGMYTNNAWGTSLYYTKLDAHSFPSGLFTSAPKCQVTAECRGGETWAWLAMCGETTKDYTPSALFCSPTRIDTAVGFNILYYAIGNWK